MNKKRVLAVYKKSNYFRPMILSGFMRIAWATSTVLPNAPLEVILGAVRFKMVALGFISVIFDIRQASQLSAPRVCKGYWNEE